MNNGLSRVAPELARLTWGRHPQEVSVAVLARDIGCLPSARRKRLLEQCSNRRLIELAGKVEEVRVVYAKVLVALLPSSERLLSELLAASKVGVFAEIQFSLFCFLDAALTVPVAHTSRAHLLQLLEQYLMAVRSSRAHAAWMAGDLLGDHWPISDSLPILKRAAKHGRFVAGREAAIHGLSHALNRTSKRSQWEIVQVLKDTCSEDRSSRVRGYADDVLGDLRGY